MDADKKLLIFLLPSSLLTPLIILAVCVELGYFDSRFIVLMIMMIVTLPMMAGGAYMWMTGKGQMGISGFNTMPKAKRDLYDGERMAKDVGKLLVFVALIILVGFGTMYYLPWGTIVFIATIGLLFIAIIAFVLYSRNDRYLKDPTKPIPPPTKHESKVKQATYLISIGAAVAIIVVVIMMMGSGNVTATMDDDTLHVSGPMMNRSIAFDDIAAIDFRDGFDHGSRIGGFGGSRVLAGNFNNSEFGDYSLACFRDVDYHIVVTPVQGRVLVFNLSTPEETEAFCEALMKQVFEYPIAG